MTTTKLKLWWLAKRKQKLLGSMELAFIKVKSEIVEFLKSVEEPTAFIKYLSTCIDTSDLPTFLRILEGVIEDAKKATADKEAIFAIRFCKYVIFRIHMLSRFAMAWSNVTIKCNHCHNIIKMNFCYTNKICPICGAIMIQDKEKVNGK